MADFQAVATQFVQHYYNTFDQDRSQLATLYRDRSMMTWEGEPFQGAQSIVQKLVALPFQKIKHQVSTQDAQPSNEQGGINVVVTGALKIDDQEQPLNYTQTFQLIPDGGSYYVQNDVFRLLLG